MLQLRVEEAYLPIVLGMQLYCYALLHQRNAIFLFTLSNVQYQPGCTRKFSVIPLNP